MFVVLRVTEAKNGIINKIKQKKSYKLREPVSHSVEKGLPFFTLDVLEYKNGIDWGLVEEKCGRYVSRIVAPRSIALPDNNRLKRFVPASLNHFLIFNTATETIKKAGLCPDDVSITVIDRNAFLCSKIEMLLPLTSSVRIVTSHPERYAFVCQKIYDEFGASIILRSSYEASRKHDIVICCDGSTSCAMNSAAVFSCKRGIYGKIRFFGNGIALSEEHKEIIPDSIDSVDFAAALSELCGNSQYKSSTFANIEINCSECKDSVPEKCLRCCFLHPEKVRNT